jgi:hypothetical protein
MVIDTVLNDIAIAEDIQCSLAISVFCEDLTISIFDFVTEVT